ncbi:hypothetical protein [Shewanella sp. MBTL60-007]|uniref:hypothetical protein n=1 Tax=Shewanella sp. MBTL60-007 TaxID=2815911 RepID=UPI001BC6E1E1|nr:hypothetical protein [Shewanella sp. MBTL60-007]GIU29554.1 hypothetical protein TUM3792_39450 [Shewanella sp. MBTL60-007]
MDYAQWIKSSYPELKIASRADIPALVKMAKASTKYLRFIVGIVVIVSILLPVNILLTSIGFVPFQDLFFWFCLILVLFLSNVITSILEQYIIKYQLKKIIRYKLC